MYKKFLRRFIELLDTPDGYQNQAGKAVIVNQTEDGVEFGEAGGAAAFTDLTDAPSSYSGQAGKALLVNITEDGLSFGTAGGGGGGMTAVIKAAANDGDTLGDNQAVFADTSTTSFCLYLPASPIVGTAIQLHDATNSFGLHNLTVYRNSSNINGLAEDLVCDIQGSITYLYYEGTSIGWNATVEAPNGATVVIKEVIPDIVLQSMGVI